MFARCAKLAAAILLTAYAAIPQELAPEVLLLARMKRHLREELAHVPNYTCLETISRFHRSSKPVQPSHQGLAKFDTVQLEIVYMHGREWYGSPEARGLNTDDPRGFVAGGMIGTGAFAIATHDIVEGGIFTYRGPELLNGRDAVKYEFLVPGSLEPLQISVNGWSGTAGEEGSIWVNPQSLDLMRLESRAVEIPSYLPVEKVATTVNYARTRIAGLDAMLAQAADLRMLEDGGIERYNHIEFTHCHAYAADSQISFDATPRVSLTTAPTGLVSGSAVAPFLEVTILLTTPVSSKDSVGSLIEGRISNDVVHKGKIVVPGGSIAHGRIRALDHYPDLGVVAVGLEFTNVEVRGELLPFYADLVRLDNDPRIERELSRRTFSNGGIQPAEKVIT